MSKKMIDGIRIMHIGKANKNPLAPAQRAAIAPYSHDFFQTVWNYLKREHKVKFFIVKHGEEMAKAAIASKRLDVASKKANIICTANKLARAKALLP